MLRGNISNVKSKWNGAKAKQIVSVSNESKYMKSREVEYVST